MIYYFFSLLILLFTMYSYSSVFCCIYRIESKRGVVKREAVTAVCSIRVVNSSAVITCNANSTLDIVVYTGDDEIIVDCLVVLFFFQAEDGIRDLTVTGVQTCALPI